MVPVKASADPVSNLLRNIVEHIPIRIFWKDKDSRYLGCNTLFARDAGMESVEEIIGKTDFDMGWKQDAASYRADDALVMQSGIAKLDFEEKQTTPQGNQIWLRASKVPLLTAEGAVIGILGIYEDITLHKQSQAIQNRLFRALKLLSQCNALLIHVQTERDLLTQICHLIVDSGGYRMAWVGYIVTNTDKAVHPIAQAGYEAGYLDHINVTWSDTERGRGPTGTAIRTGKTVVNQNYLTNPATMVWRAAAIERGYQSSIALPMKVEGKVIGALMLYAAEAEAFSTEEVKLLEELVGNVSYVIQTLRMVIAGEVSEKKLEFLENHDSLTGLPNRLLLRDRFSIAAATATRERTSIAICSLNLDNFKQINDSFGHACADQFLINAVSRLQQCLSETDTISRVVGDEFIALIPTGNDPTLIAITAQRIIDSFSEPLTANGHVAISSFSIGISIYPNDGTDFDELIKLADIALYKAKEAGRSAFRFFSQKMNVNLLERVTLQTQLHSAVKNAELCLHYQPQINTHTKQVIGAEALIRWQHPEMGLVSSAKFIPIAERSGLIIPIGEWVLQEACRQWQKWRLSQCFPQCTIAVNLSAIQFLRGDIVETVRKVLASTGLPPEYLELELTESILLQDIEGVVETLSALKRIGVQLSIDDFGTGYSSLAYLKRLDVDKLKIDKSFVDDMVTDPEAAAIVKAIIQLGHTLKLTTIAEGVEEPEQLALLDEYGCDEIQGYVFSRPLPADDFKKFCAC